MNLIKNLIMRVQLLLFSSKICYVILCNKYMPVIIEFCRLILIPITEKNHALLKQMELWDKWVIAPIWKNYASYCPCRHMFRILPRFFPCPTGTPGPLWKAIQLDIKLHYMFKTCRDFLTTNSYIKMCIIFCFVLFCLFVVVVFCFCLFFFGGG